MDFVARTATPEEKAEWWPWAVETWPPYDEYQADDTRHPTRGARPGLTLTTGRAP